MRKILLLALVSCLFYSCSNGSDDPVTEQPQPEDNGTVVGIKTRVNDITVPVGELRAGLYMVNYLDGQPDKLLAQTNYVNNQLQVYVDGAWTSEHPIYWNDMDTPADFYAYAPYQETVPNARQIPFSVAADQRSDEAFLQSDFLWGTVRGQRPDDGEFSLMLSHALSRLTVNIVADTGFEQNELQATDVSVTIGGSRTSCTVDLADGSATPNGTAGNVMCHNNGDLSFTAVLVPQEIPFSNLIQVNWRGNPYTLQNSFRLEPRRQYSLTVKLKKSKNGFDIGIAGWDIVEEDFGGSIGGN